AIAIAPTVLTAMRDEIRERAATIDTAAASALIDSLKTYGLTGTWTGLVGVATGRGSANSHRLNAEEARATCDALNRIAGETVYAPMPRPAGDGTYLIGAANPAWED
ncbi:MAG: hypothetical protein WC718_17750, partial [Phycisphaerales bacterium]